MNSKEYRELIQVYQSIHEQKIGVPLDKPTDASAARKLQQMIPKGEKVHIPKSGLEKAHYEPEGEQIDEMGPLAGLAVRGALAAGTALAGKAVYDKAKGVAGKLKQRNIQTQKAIDSLQNSYKPEGEELTENPLASLDRLAKGTVQTVGGVIGKNQGQKTGIPGGGTVGGLLGRQKGGQMYDKAKETVGGLLKQSYETEGDLVDEQEDLFDIVKGFLLDEGYVTTEEEALIMMSNMSEEEIQDIIEAAVQPSLITSKGKAQNFTKPNRVPFTSSTPVPTRSRTQATPPRRPSGGFGNKPAGQLKLDLNKPAAKPAPAPAAKPAATSQRSQQFRDVQRLTGRTGGGLMGTTKPTNLEPRAPKPAWKSTTKPTASVTKPVAKPAAAKPTAKPNTYRPGATVRATGPGMDKFPQLRRFANQARKVAEPVSKVAGAVSALRKITPAGVAASVMAPRPTGDATLKGALKSGVYKPKQGPANPDQGLTKAQSFDKKFKAARKSGAKQFTWNDKTYTTKVKESYDDFDLIQDYLIGEGYADNEKEALMIMANISAEQIQNIKNEIHSEAVGDPISPSSVFKLSDKDVQKNLQSTMKPAGPAPMKPSAPKPKQQSSSDRFVKRIVGSTMLSPL